MTLSRTIKNILQLQIVIRFCNKTQVVAKAQTSCTPLCRFKTFNEWYNHILFDVENLKKSKQHEFQTRCTMFKLEKLEYYFFDISNINTIRLLLFLYEYYGFSSEEQKLSFHSTCFIQDVVQLTSPFTAHVLRERLQHKRVKYM